MFLRVLNMMLIILIGQLPLHAQESFYPPLLDGKPDFEGLRFIVKDGNGDVKGDRPYVLKKGFILKVEGLPVDMPPLGSDRYYLAKDKNDDEGDEEKGRGNQDNDTLIRYVRTLNDLRGFVKIRTETDALEFLRFGSSLIGYQLFAPRIEEIYCLTDTSVLPDPKRQIPPSVNWATTEECQRLNLSPPKILNPLTPKERSKTGEGDDDEDEMHSDTGRKSKMRHKAKRFFLIERTVVAGLKSSLVPSGKSKILRITEEVGPEGQWRVVSTQEIPLSKEDFASIVFR